MKKVLQAVVLVAMAATGLGGLPGCAQNKAHQQQPSVDPIIQHYMQRRSDLLGQRRRLADTYGATSPQVAEVDRQIALVDSAAAQRRTQLIEEEHARQQVREMKREAAPMPEGQAASRPASRPAR
jgi:hypothetical protein